MIPLIWLSGSDLTTNLVSLYNFDLTTSLAFILRKMHLLPFLICTNSDISYLIQNYWEAQK